MRRHRQSYWAILGLLALAACGRNSDATSGSEKGGQTAHRLAGRKLDGPPICTRADLTTCATNNLATEACLTLYQACGRYLEIVEHYRSEAWSTDPSKDYYLGAAYHGLFLQNRSAAAKCQFGTSARLALLSYLNQSYQDQGYNDQRRFQQTYHATKLLETVKEIEGCTEDDVTRDELFNATYSHGRELAEGLFVGDAPPGSLQDRLKSVKATIQTSIQSFVSTASNIETQIGLRKVAMDASDARILKIKNMLESSFGAKVEVTTDQSGKKPAVTSASMPQDNPLDQTQAVYTRLHGEATEKLTAIKGALGTSDIADYERKRAKIIQYARDALTSSANSMQRATDATATSVQDLSTATDKASAPIDDGSTAFQTAKAAWKAYGERTHACSLASPPWYCK